MNRDQFVQPPPGVPLRKIMHHIGIIQTLEGIQRNPPKKFTVEMNEILERIINMEYQMLEQYMERY